MDISILNEKPTVSGAILYREVFTSSAEEKERVIQNLMDHVGDLENPCESKAEFRYRLCFDEVVQNAIEHGNANEPSKKVDVTLFLEDDQWGLVVTDEGEGFEPDSIPDVDSPEALMRENGRGLWILTEYMDHVTYYDGGRTAVLKRRIR